MHAQAYMHACMPVEVSGGYATLSFCRETPLGSRIMERVDPPCYLIVAEVDVHGTQGKKSMVVT